ncbi:hypothetical protein OIU85_010870 [Salix viminalis]|uniref:RING-type domain-containing protein n=1 Tax=Salix viminalis TaxID=40686 RepID=A0A9Q0NRJ9_SALVM|nr:hypothetical protein OIU85_010870 [Salix viminalis]KAJ6674635.1 hypothetical protein OIU85_010870 [Salix viminalis]
MMNGLDEITMTAWKNLKQRLSFKGLGGCCGGTSWGSRSGAPAMPFIDIEQDEDEEPIMQNQARGGGGGGGGAAAAPGSGMNLAMALAAERNLGAPNAKTLMSLIEETDGVDRRQKNSSNDKSRGVKEQEEEKDWGCCVCMERNKGAAFIPCGHTFCRVCSREMWENRGCCPICNRSIIDILDIF